MIVWGLRRTGASLLLACALLVGPGSETSHEALAGKRYERRSRQLAPGLRLIRILDRAGPNRIKVLRFNPASALTLDVELAQDRLPGRERTSRMARRRNAIAATNGTFGLPWGRPIGLFAEDTHLQASPLVWGHAVGMSSDESSFPMGHPKLKVTVSHPALGPLFRIPSWNVEGADPARVAAYTPVGAPRLQPPPDSCAARLVQFGSPRWALDEPGITRTYEVAEMRCGDKPLQAEQGVVLAAQRKTRGARKIKTLPPGDFVDLTWSVGWNGVVDAIAGNPLVVRNGKNVGYNCPASFCARSPRTGVGITKRGRILLVTVDGRQPGYSVGMGLRELGKLFISLNAVRAINVDGGGSTTMVVRGRVINRPSDPGGERHVSSSILILRGNDEEEPVMAPPPPAIPSLPVASGTSALRADPAVIDPGSTGGLLDAVRRGALGRRVDLPPGLARIARLFKASAPD